MRLDAGQHQRMDQRMKLAPRMIQSMEILQMPAQALEARIEQELASNPTLELREPGEDDQSLRQEREQADRDNEEGERELIVADGDISRSGDDFERLGNMHEEYGESWAGNTHDTADPPPIRSSVSRHQGERDGKIDAMANTAARAGSIHEQLMAQWRLVEAPPPVMTAGEHLLSYFDADGYLRTDRETCRDQAPRGLTEADLDQALSLLQQTLEPAGVGARDLRECLLLQIDAKRRQNPEADLTLERQLVDLHLKDIESNRIPRIAHATGRSVERIKEAILNLRQFHPHPGRLLSEEGPHAIHPDAVVEYNDERDAYDAYLTGHHVPSVSISPMYRRMARDRGYDKKTRDFVNTNLRSANWLLDAIEQRNHTLLRVIHVVLAAQRDYFDQGPQALKPLPMTTVAEQLGIHVATVSRAVHEKYLQTPRGIVPLRMFFSGGTETEGGESRSWTAVQATLQEVIDAEDKADPLNDDQLVEALRSRGLEIARRTVAKYRKQLHLPPPARSRRSAVPDPPIPARPAATAPRPPGP